MKYSEKVMKKAIEVAREHQTPFGAALVNSAGEVITTAANSADRDGPLAHAELNLLAKAQNACLETDGYTLYSTCEPCPMCMSGIVWMGIRSVVFGATIADAKIYVPQIDVSAKYIADSADGPFQIIGEILRKECVELFVEFIPQTKA